MILLHKLCEEITETYFLVKKKKSDPFPLAFCFLLVVQNSSQILFGAQNTTANSPPTPWECDSDFVGYLGWGGEEAGERNDRAQYR